MTPLDFLAQRNDEWAKMANSISQHPDETLQEAYLKLHNRFKDDMDNLVNRHPNEVSMYFWLTLKSCSTKIAEKQNKFQELPLLEIEDEEYEEEPTEEMLEIIKEEVQSWHWYDAKLFDLHFFQKMPMREINRETGISLSSIWYTLKTCRQRIKELL